MRRVLWVVLGLAMLGNVALALYVVNLMRYPPEDPTGRKKQLVEIRKTLFTRYVDDRALVTAPPERMRELGYRTDSPEAIAAWRQEMAAKIPYLHGVDPDSLPQDPIERAKAIVLLFSKNGGQGACGLGDLTTILSLIANDGGYGCCADHSDAFVALGQAFGLVVRPVASEFHGFGEIFLPEENRWVFVGAQYAVLARDENGRYLGAFEIRDRLRAGEPVRYEFFGTEEHDFWPAGPDGEPNWAGNPLAASTYFLEFDAFRDLRLPWGSNLLEQDRFEVRFQAVPQAIHSFVANVLGIAPRRVHFVDADTAYARTLQARRAQLLWGLAALAAATIVPASLLALGASRSRKRIGRIARVRGLP
jgi:hypothetical protein